MRERPGSSRIDRLIAIRSFPAYASLPLEDVEGLVNATVEREYRAGERMMREGEPAEEVFFVIRGLVQLRRRGVVIREFGPRSAVGGAAAVSRDPEGYECIAIDDTLVLAVGVDELLESMEEHFQTVRTVLSAMTEQILEYRKELGPRAGFEASDWEPDGQPPPSMNLIERISLLRGAMPFAGSRLEALADLAKESRELRLQPGEALWKEGDLAESFIFLVWGRVRCASEAGLKLGFGPGDVVGFLGPFSGQRRWYTAFADTEVVGLRLSTEALLDVFEDHSELALAMIRTMASGLMLVMNERAEANARLGISRRSQPPRSSAEL